MGENLRQFPTRGPEPENPDAAASTSGSADPDSALGAGDPELPPTRIGDWLFEPSLNRLTGDDTLRLEPMLASLLSLLARNSGRVVSKDEIIDHVWQGRFVADSALTRAMAELRRALGDDARDPRYIETISKKGYRLLATPVPIERSDASEEGDPEDGKAENPRARRALLIGAAAVALATVALTLFWRLGPADDTRPEISSVVILPLEDLSPDSEGEYFAASMTEALATDLARVGALRVISRRSVERYLDEGDSIADAASSLGADAAVEGSIVRSDGRVRIDVQLTHASTATHLWADSYERDFVDVLALQREVAGAISREISVASGASTPESRTAAVAPRVDPAAHDLYLQGRHALSRCAKEGANETESFFEDALAIDPDFAPAHAGLADYYSTLTLFDHFPPHEGFPKARTAALRALELDPGLGEAHTALAHVEFLFDWDWERAEAGFRRALELNPSDAEAHRALSFFLTCMGRFDEAIDEAELEAKLDPLNESQLPWVLFNARRYEQSLAALPEKPAMYDGPPPLAGWNYALLGRHAEAIDALTRVSAARGHSDPIILAILGWTQAAAGLPEEARETLRSLESLTASFDGDLYPQVIVHAGLGNIERALDLLEEAVTQRSPNAIFLRVEPFLQPLRESPRYQRLLRSTRLAPPLDGMPAAS